MKIRALKKVVDFGGYKVCNYEGYLAIGGYYVHDLIKLDKETLKFSFALDTFHEGPKSLKNENLSKIYNTLKLLVDSGEIKKYLEGKDELENPLSVYTFENGKIIERFADKYGYPNITEEGYLMHDNTYFANKYIATNYAIGEYNAVRDSISELIKDTEERLKKLKYDLSKYNAWVYDLLKQKDALSLE